MKKHFLDDIREIDMVYDSSMTEEFVIVRNYHDFVKYIQQNGLPPFISFDNDLGLDESGKVALDGYAAEQIRGLLNNYLKFLKEQQD